MVKIIQQIRGPLYLLSVKLLRKRHSLIRNKTEKVVIGVFSGKILKKDYCFY